MLNRKKGFVAVASVLVLLALLAAAFIGLNRKPDKCLAATGSVPKWIKADLSGFSDEFNSVHPRWNFGDIERSGYHRLFSVSDVNAVEIGINPVDQYGDSDCSFEENISLRRAGVLDLRAKCSARVEDFNGGTLGFGLWDNRDGYHYNAAWFVLCSKASAPALQGISVMVLKESKFIFQKPVVVDISRWHTYSIKISEQAVEFFIDGNSVALASGVNSAGSCKSVVAWIDNKAVGLYENSHRIDFIPVTEKYSMLIDSISWRSLS